MNGVLVKMTKQVRRFLKWGSKTNRNIAKRKKRKRDLFKKENAKRKHKVGV